ncbi:sterol desaturase family protein [Bacillus bingmayongensis]|uniref:sterol desaturase family protein n=1 Tax=Bacillus bingmayongensis TaxID=1150157 RepID=UPI0002D2A788|nr:sterol desaturase family protein [Bacillus bingmayongensis]MBY0599384.1 sterol desaturase family protein [Bacillus bingmayongensis]
MKKVYRDFFFHFDILVMFVSLLVFVLYIIYMGVNAFTFLSFFLGVVTYAFMEYFTHRFLFHMKPPKNLFLLKLIKRLHYDHHLYPNNLKLLFLPLWYSIPNAVVLSLIFYSIVHSIELTVPFTMGLTVMLLIYEWKHYIAHVSIKPSTPLGRWLKKTHLLHHFKNENYWYGVSNPFFDMIFGTLKDEKEVKVSPTAKNLEQ